MPEKPTFMTADEYDAIVQADGATCACYEGFSRMMAVWRYENPDDDRSDYEILESPEFQKWNTPAETR